MTVHTVVVIIAAIKTPEFVKRRKKGNGSGEGGWEGCLMLGIRYVTIFELRESNLTTIGLVLI